MNFLGSISLVVRWHLLCEIQGEVEAAVFFFAGWTAGLCMCELGPSQSLLRTGANFRSRRTQLRQNKPRWSCHHTCSNRKVFSDSWDLNTQPRTKHAARTCRPGLHKWWSGRDWEDLWCRKDAAFLCIPRMTLNIVFLSCSGTVSGLPSSRGTHCLQQKLSSRRIAAQQSSVSSPHESAFTEWCSHGDKKLPALHARCLRFVGLGTTRSRDGADRK